MKCRSISLLVLATFGCGSGTATPTPDAGSPASGGRVGSGGATASGGAIGSGGAQASGGAASGGSNGSGGAAGSAVGGAPGGAAGRGGANAGGRGGTTAGAAGNAAAGASGAGGAFTSTFAVVTDRYDIARSGANTSETILTTTNVNRTQFGLLFSRTIAGYVYGQPLYVGGVTIGGARHNVVYVATEHNMLYAFDADAAAPDMPLWSKSLGAPLVLGSGGYDPGCTDMRNEVGITSTPVISVADGKIFVVAKTTTEQQLHSLDLATGAESTGSPVAVGAMAMAAFDARIHLNRTALLLVNGTIYIGFGSHCDAGAYHGWLFGYDSRTLLLKTVYNSTPTGTQGAIWQSGVGPSSDGTSLFLTVGNGSVGGQNMGNHVVQLTPSGSGMTIAASFAAPVSGDNDLQSGVPLLGNTGQVVGAGKDGDILLLAQSTLARRASVALGGELNSFSFWNGSAGPTLFAWPASGMLHAYAVGNGTLTDRGANGERRPLHPSGIFTVSSNGAMAGTGIVWATVPLVGDAWHATATGALYAFDASDLTKASLWNSTLVAADNLGTFAKYSPPIVANGKVYVATFANKLQVYGIK